MFVKKVVGKRPSAAFLPDECIYFLGSDTVELFDGQLDCRFGGTRVAEEDEAVVLLNFLH